MPVLGVLLKGQCALHRGRVLLASLSVLAAQLAYRAALLFSTRLWRDMPLPIFGPVSAPAIELYDFMASASYLGFLPRSGALSLGVATAVLASDLRTRRIVRRQAPSPLFFPAAGLHVACMRSTAELSLCRQPFALACVRA